MIIPLSEVQLNDRIILPPFAHEVNYEFHSSQRSTARRVLTVTRTGDHVTVVLDGHEPRTLPASLQVCVLR